MATPLLIDADMGIDDALALSLALASNAFDIRAVVAVGGCVNVDQVVVNIGRVLKALSLSKRPMVARGLDQSGPGLVDRQAVFGTDGLGQCGLAPDEALQPIDFRAAYRQAIDEAKGQLTVVTTGPLSNIAAILAETPELARAIKHVYIAGGAVWARGNVNDAAEFNFHRDPQAAARVLSSGLPITLAPLDVSTFVSLDESHVARLAASGTRAGEILAEILQYPLGQPDAPGPGKTYIHDAVAMGGVFWSNLFMRTRMRLEVETGGIFAGRCKPSLGGDKALHINILTAVNAVDFIENVLESLCHEEFIV
jgi:pyrimidine-specific ribonucleoside hydrolase